MRKTAVWVLAAAVILGIVAIVTVSRRTRTLDPNEILAAYREEADYDGITVTYPADGTLFPPEIVAPTFRWEDTNRESDVWLVRIDFGDDRPGMSFLPRVQHWTPPVADWDLIKKRSRQQEARVVILGVSGSRPSHILSGARISIKTSNDEVGAPLFYREVNLPFIDAVTDPSRIRWRFGSIASPQPPPVVLENLPVCGNCHSFSVSNDTRTLAMDIDYANSKGSYVITRVKEKMVLATSDIITWNDYRKEDGEQTFGLLSQISPDGRYVISTVKDKSVFVPKPGLAFSQLFFPIKGILCVYDRQTKTFNALPGADDPSLVQSNPTWSPDGKDIVFARTEAYDLRNTSGKGKVLLTREECKEFLEEGKPFPFDLYRIPFNQGKGGTAQPIEGASHNGMSNFFARYSPDGRWIIFCKAKSYMLLQPDSELYIIPARGGEARRLCCNTPRMNSWHSWSPNGKWLVFASKGYSDYTQLCLTHIDEDGLSTPPVLLAHMTASDRAANIPEFVDMPAAAIRRIHEQFLDDYSFVRAGNQFFRYGEPDSAIPKYRKALELNPDNAEANHKLGFLLYHVKGVFDEGMTRLLKAAELAPSNPRVSYDLGMALLHQRRYDQAIGHLSQAIRRMPNGIDDQCTPARMHFDLGFALLAAGRSEQARGHLSRAVELDPNHPAANYRLALALADLGQVSDALSHYTKAIRLDPTVDMSPTLHHILATDYLERRLFQEALEHEERALELARRQGDEQLVKVLTKAVEVCRKLVNATAR